jgi:hypothetical protein
MKLNTSGQNWRDGLNSNHLMLLMCHGGLSSKCDLSVSRGSSPFICVGAS